MRRRGQQISYSQKLQIAEQASQGHSDRQIAQRIECSVWTVRKWRRRYQKLGNKGLRSKRGRPVTGILSTFPPMLADAIVEIRKAHPGWGADSILLELQLERGWPVCLLPHRSRVAAFLNHRQLTHPYHPATLPTVKRYRASEPHQEWEMDAQGVVKVDGMGSVSLINITDVYSRVKVESYPTIHCRNPNTEDYQLALRRAFMTFGLPKRLTLDRGTVFYDNTTPSPWPTRLHQWLLALGIEVSFTRKRRPTDHAIIERTHQILTQQALVGQHWLSPDELWSGLDRRRHMLNHHLPMRTLKRRAPLQVCPDARHSGRYYSPEREPELLDLQRLYDYLAQGRWFRRSKPNGIIHIGQSNYYLTNRWGGREIALTFDPSTQEFIGVPEGGSRSRRVKVKRLSIPVLMGEMDQFHRLPDYQLPLPFTRTDWHALHYANAYAA